MYMSIENLEELMRKRNRETRVVALIYISFPYDNAVCDRATVKCIGLRRQRVLQTSGGGW